MGSQMGTLRGFREEGRERVREEGVGEEWERRERSRLGEEGVCTDSL